MSEHTIKIEIQQGQPLPLGAYGVPGGIRFAVDVTESTEPTRLVIRARKDGAQMCEVVMNDYRACGSVCAVLVKGVRADRIYYQYMRGNDVVEDIYGMKLYGGRRFGVYKPLKERAAYEPWNCRFSWEDDRFPELDFKDMIMYKLHVRGFTRHPSSGVRHKGTFLGITEKISYFKELGVNALVLMPAVDFAELQIKELPPAALPPTITPKTLKSGQPQDISMRLSMAGRREPEYQMNCWGYGNAQFFAPKGAYAFSEPCREFCMMVKKLHEQGIEVILELLFPDTMAPGAILDCLRHWRANYHVDGFWLNREIVPVDIAAKDPMLSGAKLISAGFDAQRLYGGRVPQKKRLAAAGDDFQNTMRSFLKGDEGCLGAFCGQSTAMDVYQGSIHYITSNNGFTLADLVAYNDRHNEANGEDNRDGSSYNVSWNCGAEGPTKKKHVRALRRRQIYNALLLLLFSQGTPMLYGGDEFGNSQQGNNNAYGQDNALFWLNWNDLKKHRELFDFVKKAIRLRQSHPVLHPSKPFRQTDYLSCGFPDLSLHGYQPWKTSFGREDHYIGMMYCGKYANVDGRNDRSFYFTYNMHWEKALFSLPALPKGQRWEKIADTFLPEPFSCKPAQNEELYSNQNEIAPRSIQIFMSAEHTGEKTADIPGLKHLSGKFSGREGEQCADRTELKADCDRVHDH